MRFCAMRACFSRLVLVLLCAIPAFVASVNAQVAGRNVNMVSGGTFPGGDPFLQKQNEPSLAMSTRNPCHLLAGANDYRAVNLPGLPDDAEIGDAWLGWYESTDCGATLVQHARSGVSARFVASRHGVPGQRTQRRRRSGRAVRSGRDVLLPVHCLQSRQQRRQARARASHRPQRSRDRSSIPTTKVISPDGTDNPRRASEPHSIRWDDGSGARQRGPVHR